MLKKILLASLLALGLNAAPLAVDSVVDNLKIKDQNEVEKVIDTNVKTILFASDKSTSDMLRDYLLPLSEKENILEKNSAVYVADISGMPSLISKFIALPKMKKYPFSVLLLDDTESAARTKTSTELSGNIEGRYVEGDNILGLKIIDINTRTKSIELYKKLDEDTGYTIFLSNYGINVSNLEKRDKNDSRYTQNAPKNISKKTETSSDSKTYEASKNVVENQSSNYYEQKNNSSVKKVFEDVKSTENKSKSDKICYIVNKQNLNVRIEPNENSKILRVLKINDKFMVHKSNQDWLNIDTIYKKISGDIMNVSNQSNWVQNTNGSLSQTECN